MHDGHATNWTWEEMQCVARLNLFILVFGSCDESGLLIFHVSQAALQLIHLCLQ